MELTVDVIIAVATAIVTAIFGTCAKKFNWATQDYIPKYSNWCYCRYISICNRFKY